MVATATAGPAGEVGSRAVTAGTPGSAPLDAPGLRTDRLSAKQRERWQSIVRLVFAEDVVGRPRHPTLRKMWDEVAASGHEVYVELSDPRHSACCIAGLFRVESVDPDGHIVAAVTLNPQTIDQAVVGGTAHHGFRRFHGLGRVERYAEVLGHELGHAVWTLADPARARASLALPSRPQELARALPGTNPGEGAEIRRRLIELGGEVEALEAPARVAEAQVRAPLSSRSAPTTSPRRPSASAATTPASSCCTTRSMG
jgi:hypothetical protein